MVSAFLSSTETNAFFIDKAKNLAKRGGTALPTIL